ncbi:DUF3592 domain-containing protein [Pseudoalteromonas shioyasakiensis]|uniref:DUF3592 domain-containing protein n=1 Tax=Pseudoalteromonas shioyasakiensis TaxID=1190813 RepID=UPI0021175D0A|nr:DUF3592 domain-containing protein [Pseudoalteromonas shioyasakiensis]MCQ8877079.1 DUF3592 domain-containing protein [Pseudoalteromonas shioyasakiensis]
MRVNSVIIIITMLFLGWFAVKDLLIMVSSSNWVETDAVIIVSKVNRGHRGGPDSPWIEFRYLVAEQSYVSDKIDFGQWDYNVSALLQEYSAGKQVKAYYNPDNIEQAVLQNTGSILSNILLGFFAWGIAVITFYYRFIKREKG